MNMAPWSQHKKVLKQLDLAQSSSPANCIYIVKSYLSWFFLFNLTFLSESLEWHRSLLSGCTWTAAGKAEIALLCRRNATAVSKHRSREQHYRAPWNLSRGSVTPLHLIPVGMYLYSFTFKAELFEKQHGIWLERLLLVSQLKWPSRFTQKA